MRKRRIWPRDEFTLVSPKPKADALRILQSRTHIREGLPLRWPKGKDFVGTFTDDGFWLIHGNSYERNSSRPEIHGRVTDTGNGCTVAVRMTPQLFVSIFMGVWLSFCGLVLCIWICTVISGQTPLSFGVFVPLLMLIFGFGMFHGGFWYAAKKARLKLMALLRATVASPNKSKKKRTHLVVT